VLQYKAGDKSAYEMAEQTLSCLSNVELNYLSDRWGKFDYAIEIPTKESGFALFLKTCLKL